MTLPPGVVPHAGISWQAHVSGAVGGVIAAWLLSAQQGRARSGSGPGDHPPRRRHAPLGGGELHDALDRALAP